MSHEIRTWQTEDHSNNSHDSLGKLRIIAMTESKVYTGSMAGRKFIAFMIMNDLTVVTKDMKKIIPGCLRVNSVVGCGS